MAKSVNRIFVTVPAQIRQMAEADIASRRLSAKITRFLEISYANGGSVDSVHLRRTEINAEIAGLQAELESLVALEEAIHETQAREHQEKRSEDAFRNHVKLAHEKFPDLDWRQWLSPSRADVKPLGMVRAKAILKEETGVEL